MSDENNVVFVGGKAVEQHEAVENDNPNDNREEAMKAVREAIRGSAEEAKEGTKKVKNQDPYKPEGAKKAPKEDSDGPERGPDGKFLPKGSSGASKPAQDDVSDDGEDEDVDPRTSPLKSILKQRDKVAAKHKELQAQNQELARAREELQAQQRQFQEYMQQLQAEQYRIAQEKARFERMRKDPASVARELGYDPEQFILDLAQDGTPEGQMKRQLREMQRQQEELARFKEDFIRQQQEQQAWAEEQKVRQYRGHIERTFLTQAMNEEKHPAIASMYKGRERALLAEGDLIAAEFRELSGGREASLEEILEFLEEDLASRAGSWYSSRSGNKSTPTEKVPVSKPKQGSKGKSLSPEASSERRALGKKALKDLDEEERLAAAKESVGLALANADED